MNLRTKSILIKSLNEYYTFTKKEKRNAIDHITKQLERHQTHVTNIGIGLDADKAQAGKIFLRINK